MTTPLPQAERFAHFDHTKIYALPAVADITAVTRAELDAGTDVTGEVMDVSGFTVSGSEIETPDLLSEFVSKIPGRTSAEDSTIRFYASADGDDASEVFTYKSVWYLCFLIGGDVPGQKMNVFPTRVKSVGDPISVGENPATVDVGFSITREPARGVVIPAAA